MAQSLVINRQHWWGQVGSVPVEFSSSEKKIGLCRAQTWVARLTDGGVNYYVISPPINRYYIHNSLCIFIISIIYDVDDCMLTVIKVVGFSLEV